MLDLFAAAMLMQVADSCYAFTTRARPARCPTWSAIRNEAGVETFVAPASLRRDADGFEVATRLVYPAPRRDGERSRITVSHFDCTRRTVARRHFKVYDTQGVLLAQRAATGAEAAPEPVPANAVPGDLLGRFCPASPGAGADPCHAVPQGMTARSCPQWRFLRRNERLEVFANPASLSRHGDNFEIGLRTVYASEQARRVRSAVTRHLYDCARRTNVMLHVTTYDTVGAVVEDRDALSHEAVPASAPRGAPGETLLRDYCRR